LPKLPPPPNRLASAVAANKLRQVKIIVSRIINFFMGFYQKNAQLAEV